MNVEGILDIFEVLTGVLDSSAIFKPCIWLNKINYYSENFRGVRFGLRGYLDPMIFCFKIARFPFHTSTNSV